MRGYIKQRGKDSWSVVVYLGQDEAGKKKYKWYTVHGKAKDAEKELRRILREMDTGRYVEPKKITVKDFLAEWLKNSVKKSVAPSTYTRYEQLVKNQINPYLGKFELSKLRPPLIETFYTQLLKTGRVDKTGGVSARTALHCHRLLHKAFNVAVNWEYLARNPVDVVEAPKADELEMAVFSPEDIWKFLEAAKEDRLYPLYALALSTGMRQGELLALCWKDIDFQHKLLAVKRALKKDGSKPVFGPTKTHRSKRPIMLSGDMIQVLQTWKTRQDEERAAADDLWRDHDLVFTNQFGGPLDPHNLTQRSFKRILTDAGLPPIRFHDLRHTMVTVALLKKLPVKSISERTGHANAVTLLQRYAHVIPQGREETAATIDEVIFKKDVVKSNPDGPSENGLAKD